LRNDLKHWSVRAQAKKGRQGYYHMADGCKLQVTKVGVHDRICMLHHICVCHIRGSKWLHAVANANATAPVNQTVEKVEMAAAMCGGHNTQPAT